MKLLRTTPQKRVIRKCKLIKTFVMVMGEASSRPVFHGFTRSRPDATSMVTTTTVMDMMALLMMPVMAMLATAMNMRPRPSGRRGRRRRGLKCNATNSKPTGSSATIHVMQTRRDAV